MISFHFRKITLKFLEQDGTLEPTHLAVSFSDFHENI